jgi:hypothetical protein
LKKMPPEPALFIPVLGGLWLSDREILVPKQMGWCGRCWGEPLVSVAVRDEDDAAGVVLLIEGLVEVPSWTISPLCG